MKAFSAQHRAAPIPSKAGMESTVTAVDYRNFWKKPQKILCISFVGVTEEKIFRKLFILGSILTFVLLTEVLCLLNIYDIIQYSIFTAILYNDNRL